MANDLAVIESLLTPLTPRFDAVLKPSGIESKQLIHSILISCERNPDLANPEKVDRQSVINAAMSAGCIGVIVDGYTGQAFIIPFKRRAQLVIGYKGFNSLGARSGFVINGAEVYEDDEFKFDLGTGLVTHRNSLTANRGRLLATWAQGRHRTLPVLTPTVLSLADIMKIKNKSPGGSTRDSPWNDPEIGFPAMAGKSAKRRQSRQMPLNVMQLAAAMDEAYEERGLYSRIHPDKGLIVAGDGLDAPASPLPARQGADQAPALQLEPETFHVALADGSIRTFTNEMDWLAFMKQGFAKIDDRARLESFMNRNADNQSAVRDAYPDVAQSCEIAHNDRLQELAP